MKHAASHSHTQFSKERKIAISRGKSLSVTDYGIQHTDHAFRRNRFGVSAVIPCRKKAAVGTDLQDPVNDKMSVGADKHRHIETLHLLRGAGSDQKNIGPVADKWFHTASQAVHQHFPITLQKIRIGFICRNLQVLRFR